MTKLQEEQCNLLKKLIKLLDDNKIDYWLAFGSALGAVRHNGFIPWDDDVDIYINGRQYEKLCQIFYGKEIDNMRLDDASNRDYPFTFPKIIDVSTKLIENRFSHLTYVGGIYIDIFPLYSVSNCALFRKIGYFRRYLDYVIVEAHYGNGDRLSFPKKIFKSFFKLFDPHKAQKRLYKRYKKGFSPILDFKYLSEPLRFHDKHLHYTKNFNGYDEHVFEDFNVKIPKCCEEYLTTQYGDYMRFPPLDQRKPCHSFSYIEYSDGSKEEGG